MIAVPSVKLAYLAPELALVAGALAVLMLDAFARDGRSEATNRFLGWFSAATSMGAALACGAIMRLPNEPVLGVYGGQLGALMSMSIALVTAVVCLAGIRFTELRNGSLGAWYALVLMASAGATYLTRTADLISTYLALETLSMPLYALAAYDRQRDASLEAGLKYFLLGSVASAVLLYGGVLLYGVAGSMDFTVLLSTSSDSLLWRVGWNMLAFGLLFKLAIVPLHFWTPDVYQGSPTASTMYMAGVVKISVAAVFARLLLGNVDVYARLAPIVMMLAMASMLAGNLLALTQHNLKRMLAYSSIGHAGYILAGLTAGGVAGLTGAVTYLWLYALLTLAAFAILLWLGNRPTEGLEVETLRGLGRQHPWIAFAFSVVLLGMAGIPPLAGFFGKWVVLRAILDAGHTTTAIVLVASSAIGAYYYLRPIVVMYMQAPIEEIDVPAGRPALFGQWVMGGLLVVLVALIFVLGIRGNAVFWLAQQSALKALGQ